MKTSDDKKLLLVEVRDSGSGLSPEQQKRLFHEIVQFNAKAQQGGGGSGLGLWISRQILELHGGSVGVYSDGPGKGSLFSFSVPTVHLESDEIPAQLRHSTRSLPLTRLGAQVSQIVPEGVPDTRVGFGSTSADLRRESMLVVDDSALVRKMLRKLFEREGYAVAEAEDGAVAVDMVRASMTGQGTFYAIISIDNVVLSFAKLADLS